MTEENYQLSIKASARLHFGFMDLHGGVGRRFGSMGMALAEPALRLQAGHSERLRVGGVGWEKALSVAERLMSSVEDKSPQVAIYIEQTIPEHQGFGSGTQLALAVGHAIGKLCNIGWSSADIAGLCGRGKRSGIGVGAFDYGGFLVDGGKADERQVPPIIVRLAVPAEWRVILAVSEDSYDGLHGAQENQAFTDLPSFSDKCAGYLSRLVVMAILPAIADKDFNAFAKAMTAFQDLVGDYFAVVQQGRYAADKVCQVLDYWRGKGGAGIGQSSWGPTGFAFMPDQQAAEDLAAKTRAEFPKDFAVKLIITQPDNEGAIIAPISH